MAPSEELAAWSLDNVTVAEWDGQEYREVLHEDFENSTCIRYEMFVHMHTVL